MIFARNLFLLFCCLLMNQLAFAAGETQTTLIPYYPSAPSAGESALCAFGNSAGCEPISREMLRSLDECAESIAIMGPLEDIGFLLMDRYGETTFFQELVNRSVRATDCQLSILESSQRKPLHDSSWEIFQELTPLFKLLNDQKAKLEEEFQSYALAAADPRIATGSGATANRSRIRGEIEKIDQSIDGLLSQIPFGSQEDARKSLRPLVKMESVSKNDFNAAYSSGLDAVRVALTDAKNTFAEIRDDKTGEYKLSVSQKIELYNTPGAQALLDKLDPRRKSLGCRFDSCYRTGPKNAKMAAVIGLAGATILTLGQASPLLAAATTVGAVSLSAAQIQHSCFRQTLASSSENPSECSASSLAQTTISQVSGVQCAVDVALSSLDAVPGAIAARRLIQLRRIASLEKLETQGLKFVTRNPDGSVVTRAADGTESLVRLDGTTETIVVNGARDRGIIVGPAKKALEKARSVHFDRNVKKYSEQFRRENPQASRSEALRFARAEAQAKQTRIAELHKQCTAVKPNTSNVGAGKIFSTYAMGFSAANTTISYSLSTWDQVKDLKWASRLGFEVTSSVVFSFLSSKIISGGGTTFPKKVIKSNITSFVGNTLDAIAYQGLFQNTDGARKEIEEMAKSPTFEEDMNELLDYLHNRSDIQEYVDGVGDMSNNFMRAITGKESIQDMSAEELSKLNPEALQDPVVRERLLDLVDDKLYSSDRNYSTGSPGLDRLSFNTGYNLIGNVPVHTAIGMASFYAVCMNIDNPIKALAAFSSIQLVRGNASNFIYYRVRKDVINQ